MHKRWSPLEACKKFKSILSLAYIAKEGIKSVNVQRAFSLETGFHWFHLTVSSRFLKEYIASVILQDL